MRGPRGHAGRLVAAPGKVRAAHIAQDPGPPLGEMLEIFVVVGAVFAIIALLPPFDGRSDEDWQ